MRLGKEIREARRQKQHTYRSLSAATGLAPAYLCDIEKGRRLPPPETIRKLAEALEEEPGRWLWFWIEVQMGAENANLALCYAIEA